MDRQVSLAVSFALQSELIRVGSKLDVKPKTRREVGLGSTRRTYRHQNLLLELLPQSQHRQLVDQRHLPQLPQSDLNLKLGLSLHQSRDHHPRKLRDHLYLDQHRCQRQIRSRYLALYLLRQRQYQDPLPRSRLLDQHRLRPLPQPKSRHQSHALPPDCHTTNLQLVHLPPTPVNPHRNHQDQESSRLCSLPTRLDRPISKRNPQNPLRSTAVYHPTPL